MQEGITNFVLQNKERWEATQKELKQLVEESSAKKRKQAEPPSPERTGNATSTKPCDTALPPPAVLVPSPTPQLPPNEVCATKSAPTTEPPTEVQTEAARAAAADAEKAASLHKLRADAMAKAAGQMANESKDLPVAAADGMDCTS